MRRREFIRRSGLSALTAWAGSSMLLQSCHTEEDMIGEPNWVVPGPFNQQLRTPVELTSNDIFLEAAYRTANVISGRETPVMGYADGILGPTIRAASGTTVVADVHNELAEATNIHWHGLVLPEHLDGHPKDLIEPLDHYHYDLSINQRAGTYWYHPHPHGATAKQVFMGLSGLFLVTDPEEEALGLPSGDFEIPLIIQDKRFQGESLRYAPSDDEVMTGYLGEDVLINGIHSPFIDIASSWYRLRILNGSTARVYNLAFSNGLKLNIIGSDGGLLERTESVNSILLAPGERIDVLIDCTALSVGQEFFLESRKFSEFNIQGRQSFRLMKFKVTATGSSTFQLPQTLSAITRLPVGDAVSTRVFDIAKMSGSGSHGGMGSHAINGRTFEMTRIDETVVAETVEMWEFDNERGDEIHPMHIHAVQFQVLERRGGRGKLIASEKGWKDTILVMPRERVSVIMRFPSYKGVFVMHCHNLEHEDDGMMMNYRIV